MDELREAIAPPLNDALRFAVQHFRVSTGIKVDPRELAEAFMSGSATGEVLAAAKAHLREADPAEIADLIVEGSATVAGLRRLGDESLPEHHRNRTFLGRLRA